MSAALFATPISNLRLVTYWPRLQQMCVNLNIDETPISSRSHTHPSHSQTSRLLSHSLSLGILFPRSTCVCVRLLDSPVLAFSLS
jgi:hypothetical protein